MILKAIRNWREQRAIERHAIPDALWQLTLLRYPFLAQRSAEDLAELRRLCSLFLAGKEFHGVAGFEVSDEIAVAVAAQACLPVLRLGLGWYDGFVGIVMHAGEVVAQRRYEDEDGIVHEYDEELAGEAMEGGPLMLAWQAIAVSDDPAEFGADAVYNVVIHEFAHVIDMRDGLADGVPPLDAAERERWIEVIDAEWETFCQRVDAGEDTLIDPYGAEAVEEFFAVAVEAFFVAPAAMRTEEPAMYALLAGFFKQDPAA
ncbi:M90 family metallopeptidase [Pelomonas aquatica]|uniref:Zinc-dependent peptidase n=1 Tax=Pelomonas aquatica TaxID=431058 RepID=A0A9X4LID3_9BURK|nr:M90 family metallopeptidase [Pelomonas aquatica]MCY4757002.1 zinc-dependent peptidase [Pelomonas aquatica]MDG0863012.1 zinc-dependent peptidase [Pelomonas aquatica]